ncbi:hypothetical protein NOC27_2399 [Nitrosococcus oceani AFC27]|nr:hypothetical protein NOC27_2399 [Nitrosococcus oceani AFC27]
MSHTPMLPSLSSYLAWIRALKNIWRKHPEWKAPPWKESMRKLPSRHEQA